MLSPVFRNINFLDPMETVSTTDLVRSPRDVLRLARHQPVGVTRYGKTKLLLVPPGYSGPDPLDRLTIDDVPSHSRYQRSDIFDWLVARHVDELLLKHPRQTLAAMRRAFEERFTPDRLHSSIIGRWRDLLDQGQGAISRALGEDTEDAVHLRQVAPTTGLLGLGEREDLLQTSMRLYREAREAGHAA